MQLKPMVRCGLKDVRAIAGIMQSMTGLKQICTKIIIAEEYFSTNTLTLVGT